MAGMLEPLTWQRLVSTWDFSVVPTVLAVAAVLGYLLLARAVGRFGGWPAGRTAAFVGAAVVAVVAIESGISAYSMTLYWMHMVQHLLLIMVVPVLVVLGQPLALLERYGGRAWTFARRCLHSRVGGLLTTPMVALALYGVVLIGTHLTSFMDAMSRHMWLHAVEVVVYLLAGYLFFVPLLANEPLRRRVAYPLRLLWMMIAMGVDAFVGVTLMMTSSDALSLSGMHPRPWGLDPLTDLHTGGALMWVGGSGLMLFLMVLAMAQWMRDRERREDTGQWLTAARRDALAGTGKETGADGATMRDAADMDGDAALDAYNQMLASLARGERR
ncbi:MAG: cytochrome c oxidase assembly protein, partial [Streptosporangiales bacterium]